MKGIEEINPGDYSYDLPSERIARYPVEKRDQSKLLVYNGGNIDEDQFHNILKYLPEKSLLVYNNTKVVQARLLFRKATGAKIEIFCLEPHEPADYEMAFSQKKTCEWKCLAGNLKKWKNGKLEKNITTKQGTVTVIADKIVQEPQYIIVRFCWDGDMSFGEILEYAGKTPIPPYLERDSEEIDKTRYQTIYSVSEGSVAAPTAGLHFTDELIERIKSGKHNTAEITLHVGAGTFRPVKGNKLSDHKMHTEHFSVNRDTLNMLLANDKIISTGTTTLRALESIYWLGVRLINGESTFILEQWDAYQMKQNTPVDVVIHALLDYLDKNKTDYFSAATRLMVVPGYKFRMTGGLITNFHQPGSTLLMLVAAYIGDGWKDVYSYALDKDFRFLSYGDSSLLLPEYYI
ncbi:MAG: S-adenosylmethionine:tRNA ribosyltransferase-isomerase [Bacteroidota bacterium]